MTINVDDPILARAVVEFELDPVGAADAYTPILGLTSVGATGVMAAPKDKTTLTSTAKEYGTALPDTPDKDIKGQYFDANTEQKALVAKAVALDSIKMKTTWDNGTSAIVTLAMLGFQIDDKTAEDWLTFTIKAKQSGEATWTFPA